MMRRNRMVKSQPPPGKMDPAIMAPTMVTQADISGMLAMAGGPPREAPVAVPRSNPLINNNVTASAQATVPVPPTSAAHATITSLQNQVQALTSKVQQWQQILTEITQSVFVLRATVTVDSLPYYTELPASKSQLVGFAGKLHKDQEVTVMFPQVQRADFVFMRLRLCNLDTAEVQQYYVPVANNALTAQELQSLALPDGQYMNRFRNPGE
jgi:hypothetical protein